MAVADLSHDRVISRLAALEETYDSFGVSQTTLSVAPVAYERARERCGEGLADNDVDDVLLVEGDGDWVVPHAKPPTDESLEAATRRSVAEQTGVECRITDLERVTILGVRDDEDQDRDTVYRIVAVFAAEQTGGSTTSAAAWHSDLPDSAFPDR